MSENYAKTAVLCQLLEKSKIHDKKLNITSGLVYNKTHVSGLITYFQQRLKVDITNQRQEKRSRQAILLVIPLRIY